MAFLAGVLIGQFSSQLAPPWLALMLLAGGAGLRWLAVRSATTGGSATGGAWRARAAPSRLASAAAALLLGYAWLALFAQARLAEELPAALQGRDLQVVGTVAGVPERHGRRLRFVFDVEHLSHAGREVDFAARLRLSWYADGDDGSAALRAGQRWRFTVRLRRPRGFANPHGFDYPGWLFRHAIRATGYVRRAPPAQRLAVDSARPAARLHAARQWLGERLDASLSLHREARQPGLLRALAIGQRDGLSPALWDDLRRTGTNHLVAISGLHIGLVAGLVGWLASRLWGSLPWLMRRASRAGFAAVAACPAALGYAALAGFSVPTQRALAMLAVALAALLLRRRPSAWRGFSLALLAVLLVDPLAPMGVDFWLSFAAVAVILLTCSGRWLRVARPAAESQAAPGDDLRGGDMSGGDMSGGAPAAGVDWRDWPRLQLAISLGLLPLTLLFFDHGSLVAPLVNLLAVPLMGLALLPLTLAGALLAAVDPWLASWPLWLADLLADGLVAALGAAADLPLASWQRAVADGWPAVLALLGALLLVLPASLLSGLLPGPAPRWLALPLCLPALLWLPPAPRHGSFQLEMLDVGQGLAVLLRTADHALLYDAGARYSARFDAGSAVVLPHLRGERVARLDLAIASHGDNDHRGGLPAVFAEFPVDDLLASFDWAALGIAEPPLAPPLRRCTAGQHWRWDGVDFRILHPPPGWSAGAENDASCVLRITAADGTAALLPGDIEAAGEAALLAAGATAGAPAGAQAGAQAGVADELAGGLASSAVLIAPHHGSRSSSSADFIAALEADWVLLPVGHRNRYGFPHAEVLARYRASGARILRSDRDGAVGLLLGAGGVHELYRARGSPAYWTDTGAQADELAAKWARSGKSSMIAAH